MRRLSAHYLFIGNGEIIKYGIIDISAEGIVTSIIDSGGSLVEAENIEFYNGAIMPIEGIFEIGNKVSGINWIENIDIQNICIKHNSKAIRLL